MAILQPNKVGADVENLTLQLLISFRVFKLLLALWASNKYLAGPKGQHKISSWPKGPAQDLWQPEAAHDFVVARGHNFLRYRKIK